MWIVGTIWLLFGATLPAANNLLIVSVDTLRADRLSAYGYAENQTPNIDQWAAAGTLFENAFAEVPLTLPSHSTLLTGTLPFFHGVRDNAGFVLPPASETLAELLRSRGYETGAFVSSYVLDSRFGLDQGFDLYDDEVGQSDADFLSATSLRRGAGPTTDRFLKWLRLPRDKPFFAWVHFYDPHTPYSGSYDQQVALVDQSIGRIDSALRNADLLDSTHIVFTADHGESLGEHSESTHGFFVYDATLKVPLIVRPAAGFEALGKRVSEQVSLADILPTALRLLGLPMSEAAQGRSLLNAFLGRTLRVRPLYAESLLPHLQFGWGGLASVRQGRYKLIETTRPELYDTRDDPAEMTNLFTERQALGRQLQDTLRQLKGRYASKEAHRAQSTVDLETAQRLGALGYVALTVSSVDGESFEGTDPKDRIRAFEGYQNSLSLLRGGAPDLALAEIRKLREEYGDFRGLTELAALSHQAAGRLDLAVDAYRAALRTSPDNNLSRSNLGQLLVQLRQYGPAEKAFAEVLSRDPSDFRSRNNLALLLRMRGKHVEALSELKQVVQSAEDYAPGWTNLGMSLVVQGDLTEAERAFRRAIRLDPKQAAAHLHLGHLLARLGRLKESELELSRAAELDPRLRQKQP